MSKAQILEELPRLTPQERAEILDCLWSLEEKAGPTETEQLILNEEQSDYDADPSAGAPWHEVESRLRAES
jgi:putative addiction module component (TIGR02574 family)